MRSITLAVSLLLGLVAAVYLVGSIPDWVLSISIIGGIIAVSIDLYLQRNVVFEGDSGAS